MIAARMYPSAHPDCMMLIALLRCCGGQVSLTSTAPEAHSPPMPIPRSARQKSSWRTLCEVEAPSDASEKMRMVPIRARVRPMRSATMPKITPPVADMTSVIVPSMPAVASLKPK